MQFEKIIIQTYFSKANTVADAIAGMRPKQQHVFKIHSFPPKKLLAPSKKDDVEGTSNHDLGKTTPIYSYIIAKDNQPFTLKRQFRSLSVDFSNVYPLSKTLENQER